MPSHREPGCFTRRSLLPIALLLSCVACQSPVTPVQARIQQPPEEQPSSGPEIRATGTVQAVRALTIQVPQITGQNGRLTLVKLISNGTRVKEDDVLAEFDRTQQLDLAREAQAKFDELSHQVRQKAAQNRSDAEKRSSDLKQAQADLAKAEIQLKKGPVLADIERMKAEEKAAGARTRIASFLKTHAARDRADAAAIRILELQRDRQKVALERAERNADKLVLKAPIDGMVALDTLWRGGSMGHAQEGDQLWNGQSLLKIFDPSEMEVRTFIGEPDGAVLKPGAIAKVYLDAYPDAVMKATFHSASPVATTALGSPIKQFTARFKLEGTDPRLLPDLSAAVIVSGGDGKP